MHTLKKRNQIFSNNLIIISIVISIIFLGIGFAYIDSSLSINGDFLVSNNTWDVHFEEGYILKRNVSEVQLPTISDLTKMDFNITFLQDDAFYEVYFFVKNNSVVDARLSDIIHNIPSEMLSYIKYEVSYDDGSDVNLNDIIKAGDFEIIRVSLRLNDDFANAWISNHPEIGTSTEEENIIADFSLNFSFELKYVQDLGEGILREKSNLIKSLELENKVKKETPNFSLNPTSESSGLYVDLSTLNDKNPIYYYRGIVGDNNILFANMCWKIVRTIDNGGIKLIYNGTPNSSKQCTSNGVTSSVSFNRNYNSLADVGYMYGVRYVSNSFNSSSIYIFGNDVNYDEETGLYSLVNTVSTTAVATQSDSIQRHYTCMSTTEDSCNVVYYVYTYSGSYAYAYSLSGVSGIEEAIDKMFANNNDSEVLTALNVWYKTNIEDKGYSNYIEDAIWCNDRTMVDGPLYSKDSPLVSNVGGYFASYWNTNGGRGLYTITPNPAVKESEACPNVRDQFTTDRVKYGNNKLKYSVGLLTADEVALAGSGYNSYSTSSYLYNGYNLWTMTPSYYASSNAYNFYWSSYNNYSGSVASSYYLRPSIVLKAATRIASGIGTATDPYIIGG